VDTGQGAGNGVGSAGDLDAVDGKGRVCPRDCLGEGEAPGAGGDGEIVAAPEVLLTMARRAPLASVMTLAVTPRLSELMVLATSFRVLVPVPVENGGGVAGGVGDGKAAGGERRCWRWRLCPTPHEAVLARLVTITVVVPDRASGCSRR